MSCEMCHQFYLQMNEYNDRGQVSVITGLSAYRTWQNIGGVKYWQIWQSVVNLPNFNFAFKIPWNVAPGTIISCKYGGGVGVVFSLGS